MNLCPLVQTWTITVIHPSEHTHTNTHTQSCANTHTIDVILLFFFPFLFLISTQMFLVHFELMLSKSLEVYEWQKSLQKVSHYIIGASFDSSISISFILYHFDMFILSIGVHREKYRSWHLNWPGRVNEGKLERVNQLYTYIRFQMCMYINQYVHNLPKTLEKIGFSLSWSLSFPNPPLFLFCFWLSHSDRWGAGCISPKTNPQQWTGYLVRYRKRRQALRDLGVHGDYSLYPTCECDSQVALSTV